MNRPIILLHTDYMKECGSTLLIFSLFLLLCQFTAEASRACGVNNVSQNNEMAILCIFHTDVTYYSKCEALRGTKIIISDLTHSALVFTLINTKCVCGLMLNMITNLTTRPLYI